VQDTLHNIFMSGESLVSILLLAPVVTS